MGIPRVHIDNLTLLIAVMSLIGARLFSWWFYFPAGSSLLSAFTSPGGGMVLYGGLLFGGAAVVIYAGITRLPLGKLMDLCAPGVALGLAFGRIGCFLAGCCWGDLCVTSQEMAKLSSTPLVHQVQTFPGISPANFPLAVSFPPEAGAYRQHRNLGLIEPSSTRSRPVHPVQLYEASLALILAIVLHLGFRRPNRPGHIAIAMALGYAAIRFGTEFLRADNSPAYGGFTLSQVISLIVAMAAGGVLFLRRRSARLEVTPSADFGAASPPPAQP
jgi:phosphatidylglycerol---prolipoprotein diacylglyceryl transferase